jgi:hypothetical protein
MLRLLSVPNSVKRFFIQSVAPSFAPYLVDAYAAIHHMLYFGLQSEFSTCG